MVNEAETTVAKQNVLNKMTSSFNGRTPVRIHFLDNSSKMLLVESTMEAKDIIKILLEKYEVRDIEGVYEYFALYESKNGSAIDGALPLDMTVADVVQGWTDENSKLVFMIRLFMPSLWGLQHRDVVAAAAGKPKDRMSLESYLEVAEVIDPNLLHLQYMQAVYHVITGQYPTSQDQALILGSLHFLYKFGEFNSNKHKVGFLGNRIVEFIPVRYLKKKSLEQWETILFETLETHQATLLSMPIASHSNPHEIAAVTPQHRYMDNIFRLPKGLFGCTFFRCSSSVKAFPETVVVGIHCGGINIYDKSSDRNLLKSFPMDQLLKWGCKPNIMFNFEIFPTDDYPADIVFMTGDGPKMTELLTDYALAYMKEKAKEEERAETLNTISVSEYLEREKQLNEISNTVPVIPKMAKKTSGGGNGPKREYSEEERIIAATKMQARYRGYALRSQWAYEDAAIRIQSVYRGYCARVRVFKMIEALMEAGELGDMTTTE